MDLIAILYVDPVSERQSRASRNLCNCASKKPWNCSRSLTCHQLQLHHFDIRVCSLASKRLNALQGRRLMLEVLSSRPGVAGIWSCFFAYGILQDLMIFISHLTAGCQVEKHCDRRAFLCTRRQRVTSVELSRPNAERSLKA